MLEQILNWQPLGDGLRIIHIILIAGLIGILLLDNSSTRDKNKKDKWIR